QEELAIARPGLPNSSPFFILSGYITRRRNHFADAESGGKIAFGVGKVVAAARDIARENEERRGVRQTWPSDREFFLGSIVVAQTPEVIIGPGETRFSRVRAQTERCLHCSVGHRNAIWRRVEIEKEQEIVRARCITICR